VTDIEDIQQQVDQMLQPLRSTLQWIDQEIADHEQQISDLKQARRKPAQILAAAEREPGTKPGPKVKSKTNGKPFNVSEDKLSELTAYLNRTANSETFSVPELMHRDDFDLMSSATLAVGLKILAERGIVRLDSMGGPQSHQRRNYRLVRQT
jgi:hypothetical protein